MQIENDYEKGVYNGDAGYIDDVDADTGELVAIFDGRAVTYAFGGSSTGRAPQWPLQQRLANLSSDPWKDIGRLRQRFPR